MFRQWLVGCLPEEEFTPWAWQMLAKKRQAVLHALATLRGKNLACWCAEPEPGQPDMCHAAVLLELATGKDTIGWPPSDNELVVLHADKVVATVRLEDGIGSFTCGSRIASSAYSASGAPSR